MPHYHVEEISHAIQKSEYGFVNMKMPGAKALNLPLPAARMLQEYFTQDMFNDDRGYRQSIIVKFLPATDTKGARHKAYNSAKSKSITRDYHTFTAREVAQMLANELGWGDVVMGVAGENGTTVFITC